MTSQTVTCALADITDGQAKGIVLRQGSHETNVLIARRGTQVFAYVNSCPHAGTPLDWQPDSFMSPDGSLLQCATHGAQFRVVDGHCVHGPCMGKRLRKLSAWVQAGDVHVALP